MSTPLSYVLISPARDEAQYIEATIKSVLDQTVLPLQWIIVSDGSTDGTDAIVNKYAAEHAWIELERMPERRERHFAAKAYAFQAGHAKLRVRNYDIIANLDADVQFAPDYFGFLLTKFAANPRLGVAGTPFTEGTFQYDYRFTSIEHVSGQIQLFRRECFESIGGYVPRKIGGIDHVAVITARMKGWETRTFLEKTYVHHRKMGTATRNVLAAIYKVGQADYILGSHPLWHFCRCLYQMTRPPLVLNGLLRLAGYAGSMLAQVEQEVPPAFIQFRRREQMHRLRRFLLGNHGTGRQPKSMQSAAAPLADSPHEMHSTNTPVATPLAKK